MVRGMRIEIDLDISDEEQRRLMRSMDCTKDDLPSKISGYAKAATTEYIKMTSGDKVFTRYQDLQQYRLFLLIQSYFDNIVPSERDVCSLFHISSARSLIKPTFTLFGNELYSVIDSSIKTILEGAEHCDEDASGDHYRLQICNANMVDEINSEIEGLGGDRAPLKKISGTVSVYRMEKTVYEEMCEHFGIEQ